MGERESKRAIESKRERERERARERGREREENSMASCVFSSLQYYVIKKSSTDGQVEKRKHPLKGKGEKLN